MTENNDDRFKDAREIKDMLFAMRADFRLALDIAFPIGFEVDFVECGVDAKGVIKDTEFYSANPKIYVDVMGTNRGRWVNVFPDIIKD